MKIGLIGLGKMGLQITTRLLNDGHEVVVMDLAAAAVESAVAQGATAAATREDLVKQLEGSETPVVWLMIPSGFVEAEIEAWSRLLPAGSIIVDGGNSDFRQTLKRAAAVQTSGLELVDVGTSGGILGIKDGFSMMVGGSDAAVATVTPVLVSLAQIDGWAHFGPTGTGHYIKMIHNGIEYAAMEAYAEGYRLLKDGSAKDIDLARVAEVWQHGSIIASGLNGLVAEVLSANPDLTGVSGYVAENGEAGWTLEAAATEGIAMPALQVAVDVRAASQEGTVNFGTKLLAALRNAFGGHPVNK